MKKNIFSVLLLLTCFALPTSSNAAVRSIIDDTSTTNSRPQKLPRCEQRGYHKTSCPTNYQAKNFCPGNNRYFKSCVCNTSIFQYSRDNCRDGKILGGESCGGKYSSCLCNPKTFPYNRQNCRTPKMLDGKSCDGNYEGCKCPAKFSEECAYPLVGSGKNCDKFYTSCKCASNFKSCPHGPDKDAEVCKEPRGGMKYSKCFTMPAPQS